MLRPLSATGLLLAGLLLLPLAVAACQAKPGAGGSGGSQAARRKAAGGAPAEPAPADRPFHEGSPREQERVHAQMALLGAEDPAVRLEAARKLGRLGEPAVAALISALAADPLPRTRAMAAYTLGYLGDRRAVPPLAAALGDPEPDVAYDAAAALLRLGDDRGVPRLIAGLEHADPRVRAQCVGILSDATGSALGFEPDGDPIERQAAVARWRGWLERKRETGE